MILPLLIVLGSSLHTLVLSLVVVVFFSADQLRMNAADRAFPTSVK